MQRKSSEEVAFANRWKQGTKEYLCTPYFLNTVPSVQAGPFFKKIGLTHSFEEFADYHLSSLEKNYVWKPHINVAKCLDIVDQEALVSGSKDQTGDKLNLSRGNIGKNKIAWMKKTTYLTNNLYDNVHKFTGDEGIVTGYKEKATRDIGENEGPFTENSIEKSFVAIEKKTKNVLELQKDNKSKGHIEWMAPLLPDDILWDHELSLLRYDKDPTRDGIQGPAVFSDGHIANSIVTNIRAMAATSDYAKHHKVKHAVSLVIPSDQDPEVFNWARDYRMDILAVNVADNYLFTLDNPDSSEPVVSFVPLRSKLELKRLTKDDCSEHTAAIKRRAPSESEEISSKRLRTEISSSDFVE
jgi:hypothetical protein